LAQNLYNATIWHFLYNATIWHFLYNALAREKAYIEQKSFGGKK
jgi:hypothetical protein